MSSKEGFGWATSVVTNSTTVVAATTQLEHTLQIAVLTLGVISGIMSVAYTSYKWYKKVTHHDSHGGKRITEKEVDEGFKEVMEVIKNVNKDK